MVAAFGDLIYQGVYYTNYLSEIHVGDPLGNSNPAEALFNANTDGTVTIGENGFLTVLDPFGSNAAWLGTRKDTTTISACSEGNFHPDTNTFDIKITVNEYFGLAQSSTFEVRGMAAAGVPNADGFWRITQSGADVYLLGSVFAGTFVAPTGTGLNVYTPTMDRILEIHGITDSGVTNHGTGLCRVETTVGHGYETGDQVNISDVDPSVDGQWVIYVVNVVKFDLLGSVFGPFFIAGPPCLRYFAGMLAQTFAIGDSFQDYKFRAFADGSLRIKNAVIELESANGSIVLDPDTPSITVYDTDDVNPAVTIESLQQDPIVILDATNASPSVITMNAPHTYVNGDTLLVRGSHGNTAINGLRIVELLAGPSGVFILTDLNGTIINGNGAYTGNGTASRYYSGIVTQTLALGNSFTDYWLRAFADGQIVINSSAVVLESGTRLSSITGVTPDVLTLIIQDGVLNISGTGVQAGNGTITIDGPLTAGTVNSIGTCDAGDYSVGGVPGVSGAITLAVESTTVLQYLDWTSTPQSLTVVIAQGVLSANDFTLGIRTT